MKKKTVYPPCLATVSRKHKWLEHFHDDDDTYIPLENPVCEHCGITDDTVTIKQEDQQEARVAYS